MKALTLTVPWAQLVVLGEKQIETRAMLFSYRGPVAIHAALTEKDPSWRFDGSHVFCRALARHGFDPAKLAHGAVVGTVDFVDGCRFDGLPYPLYLPAYWRERIGPEEKYFGNFSKGRAGILMASPRTLKTPIPARGMNGLWNWEPPPDFEAMLV